MANDMKLFWDLNPNNPKHWIYEDYIDAWGLKTMIGGYNFQHFTIYDNESLTEERKKEISSRYTPGTVQHSRSILGQRVVADGLIYQAFADNVDDYYISYDDAKKLNYQYLYIGVDIGGNKSKHTFVLSGITHDWKLIALKSVRVETDIDPEELASEYIKFVKQCLKDFPVQTTYFENAEQVLKKGFQTKTRENNIPVSIRNCIKNKINERINAVVTLIAQNRFYYTDESTTVKDALSEAIWCPKAAEKGEDIRLDDGTTDIDTLDAFEYSFERQMNRLIKAGG